MQTKTNSFCAILHLLLGNIRIEAATFSRAHIFEAISPGRNALDITPLVPEFTECTNRSIVAIRQ